MRSDDYNSRWEQIQADTQFKKNCRNAYIFLCLISIYKISPILSYFNIFLIGITSMIILFIGTYFINKKAESFLYELWEKSLDDYRYESILDNLYSSYRLDEYLIKDGNKLFPYEVYYGEY